MRQLIGALFVLGLTATASLAHPPEMCPIPEPGNGFWSLGHIFMFVSALIVGVAALLLYLYLELPLRLIKWLFLIVGVLSVSYGYGAPLGLPPGFWAFFGALGIGGFAAWFFFECFQSTKGLPWRLAAAFATVAWSYIAHAYDEPVVGFMAVTALGYVIASSKMVDVVASPLGIGEVTYSGSTTLAGFIILMLYLLAVRQGLPVAPFEFGALYVSGLVFSVSLLIGTWSGFSKSWLQYLWHEALLLTVALVAVVYGSEVGAEDLVQLGGTLLAVWVLIKVGEFVSKIFWRNPLLALTLLLVMGVSGALMSVSLMEHADFLRAYTLLP